MGYNLNNRSFIYFVYYCIIADQGGIKHEWMDFYNNIWCYIIIIRDISHI